MKEDTPNIPGLTTVMLTRNSTAVVEPLLKAAARNSQEVILLDDFSSDEIEKLAARYGAVIIRHAVDQNFAEHRNFALNSVKTTWTLFLDADELPTPGFWEELRAWLADDKKAQASALQIRRRNVFLGRTLRYGEAGETFLLRAAKTKSGKGRWQRAVHETWNVPGGADMRMNAFVVHQAPVSVADFVAKLNSYSQIEARIRPHLSALRLLLELAVFPPGKFLWNFFWKQGFRDGFPGFSLAVLMSYYSAIERIQQYEASLE